MEHIIKKIKLSIPLVTLYQSYKKVLSEIDGLDKSNIGNADNLINNIPLLIDEIKQSTISDPDSVFKLATLSYNYDSVLSGLYDLFGTNTEEEVSTKLTSHTLHKSDMFIRKMGTMFSEIVAMYEVYRLQFVQIDDMLMNDLVSNISSLPMADVRKLYEKYPNCHILYGYYLYNTNNQDAAHELTLIKNSLFTEYKQVPPSTCNPPLQSIGIANYRNKTLADIAKFCFKKSTDELKWDEFVKLVDSEHHGILLIDTQLDTYIYDIHTLLGQENTDKYKSTSTGCLSELTLEQYNTIIHTSPIYNDDINPHRMTRWADINSKTWIIMTKLTVERYDLMYINGYIVPKHNVDRITRGASLRIQQLCQLDNKKILDSAVAPPADDDNATPPPNQIIQKIYNVVSELFITMINEQQPKSYYKLVELILHPRILSATRNTIMENIVEFEDPRYKSELILAAASDMGNIISNFKLSMENKLQFVHINKMIFKEKDGPQLYNVLVNKITPIYLQTLTEIIVGKTDIFKNIQDRYKLLNIINKS